MKKHTIIGYVASKSSSHILACLTLAHEELKKNPHTQVLFFTSATQHDMARAQDEKIRWLIPLPLVDTAINRFFVLFPFVFYFCITLCKTFCTLLKHRPSYIVATEGLVAVPVIMCARLLAIPVHLYILNMQPRKATKSIIQWFSIHLYICFAETKQYFLKYDCYKVDYPVRFFTIKQVSQQDAVHQLGFFTERKTISIFGGSQGAVEINKLFYYWVTHNSHLHSRIQIAHQTGPFDTFDWALFYAQHNIIAKVYQFDMNIGLYYAAADLIICQASPGILFEALFFGKKCIITPFETSIHNSQLANAMAMQKKFDDLFTLLPYKQVEDNPYILDNKIAELLHFHDTKNNVTPQSHLQL